MNTMDRQQTEHDMQRMQANREELVEHIAGVMHEDGTIEPLAGILLGRRSVPLEPLHSVLKTTLCVIAQGSKEVLLGDSRFVYDPEHYLLATVELPSVTQVLKASKEKPYLSFRLVLSPALVSAVMAETDYALAPGRADMRAVDVSPLDVDLMDAVVRLMRLLDSPTTAQVLMPLIIREVIYRLLIGDQGGRLCHLVLLGGHTPDIARAVERLRQNFDQPIRIEELARELGMSVSGF